MSASVSRFDATMAPGPWRRALAALAVAAAVVLCACWRDVSDAVGIWSTSTAYTHCFLIVPMAAVLAVQPGRWERIRGCAPRPDARWLILLPMVASAWFVADRLGIAEGRQLCVVAALVASAGAVLGNRGFRAAAAPILYLFLLVPVGEFLVPSLQSVTVWFITTGLDAIGLLYFNDGLSIDIPEGRFYVAEACAGLRFLIACVAFGVTYALVFYRSWPRRVAFVVAALVVPVVANGMRAFGIVYLGHVLGSAEAAAVDHLLYGYIFFSIVVGVLAAAGYFFVQRPEAPSRSVGFPATPSAPVHGFVRLALAASVAFAAAPFLGGVLDAAAASPTAAVAIPLVAVPGCERASGAGASSYDCGGVSVSVHAEGLLGNPVPDASSRFGRMLPMQGEMSPVGAAPGMAPWRLTTSRETGAAFARAFFVDGAASRGGLRERIALARGSLFGFRCFPVRVVASANAGPRGLVAVEAVAAAFAAGDGIGVAVRSASCGE